MNVAEWVVPHTLGKIDGIQHFDPVATPYKELPHLTDQAPFRIGDNERGRIVLGHALHQV